MEKIIQTDLGEQIACFYEIDYPGMEFHILASIDNIKGCVIQAENMEDAEAELKVSVRILKELREAEEGFA